LGVLYAQKLTTPPAIIIMPFTRLTLSLLMLASLPLPAVAGNIYKFSDAHGHVLFTNVVNARTKPTGESFKQYTTLEKVTWFADTNVHQYGNWGDSEAAVRQSFSKNRNAFDAIINTTALAQNVDHGLLKAIIHTESGFNPRAHSKPGAQGLMQLMPATASMYGVVDAYNPKENIQAGARHIKYLIDRYKSLDLALAAYNSGEGNVKKYGGIPPFAETRDYVKRVLSRYHHLYGGPATALASISPPRQ
jgi:soluble lytic murein transglycosylase-like protein